MGAQGTALLDFGAFPGSAEASVAVADTNVAGGSLAEAWVWPADTADHTSDEHLVEDLTVYAASPSAGVGFTIYGRYDGPGDTLAYGKWTIGWVWN